MTTAVHKTTAVRLTVKGKERDLTRVRTWPGVLVCAPQSASPPIRGAVRFGMCGAPSLPPLIASGEPRSSSLHSVRHLYLRPLEHWHPADCHALSAVGVRRLPRQSIWSSRQSRSEVSSTAAGTRVAEPYLGR